MSKEKEKKTDEEILFPEVIVGDITVRPWTFGVLFKVSELIDQIITKMEEKNVDIDSDFIGYMTMFKIFSLATEQVLEVMEISLNIKTEEFTQTITKEKIKELPLEDGVKIAMIIAKQNWQIISKNVFNLLQKNEKKETTTQTSLKEKEIKE